jgi:hypothetical protein
LEGLADLQEAVNMLSSGCSFVPSDCAIFVG